MKCPCVDMTKGSSLEEITPARWFSLYCTRFFVASAMIVALIWHLKFLCTLFVVWQSSQRLVRFVKVLVPIWKKRLHCAAVSLQHQSYRWCNMSVLGRCSLCYSCWQELCKFSRVCNVKIFRKSTWCTCTCWVGLPSNFSNNQWVFCSVFQKLEGRATECQMAFTEYLNTFDLQCVWQQFIMLLSNITVFIILNACSWNQLMNWLFLLFSVFVFNLSSPVLAVRCWSLLPTARSTSGWISYPVTRRSLSKSWKPSTCPPWIWTACLIPMWSGEWWHGLVSTACVCTAIKKTFHVKMMRVCWINQNKFANVPRWTLKSAILIWPVAHIAAWPSSIWVAVFGSCHGQLMA